ncbi:type II secretion system protein [Candidatus Kaiserbacteria bacterium]|nr:type II secretion system protein [Candidatus Kaiserbacteria bacterium]
MRFARQPQGFSLIEIVITLFIVGVTLVLLQTVPRNLTLVRLAKDQDIALRIVDSELEVLRAGGYAALPASGSFSASQLALLPSGSGSLAVSDFNTKTKQVVATVSWQEPSRSTLSSVSLTTLITQVGGLSANGGSGASGSGGSGSGSGSNPPSGSGNLNQF